MRWRRREYMNDCLSECSVLEQQTIDSESEYRETKHFVLQIILPVGNLSLCRIHRT